MTTDIKENVETEIKTDIKTKDKNDTVVSNIDLTRQVLQKIREYMAAEKISMSEFARQTGVSKAWLSKLKHTDANLSLNTAQDLLHYMGYTLRLTREGMKISRSRLYRYAYNNYDKNNINNKEDMKDLTKIYVQPSFSLKNKKDYLKVKQADGMVTQVSPTPTSTMVPAQPAITTTQTQTVAPVTTAPAPVKLSPGQTLTVSAEVNTDKENVMNNNENENEFALLYQDEFFSNPLVRLRK